MHSRESGNLNNDTDEQTDMSIEIKRFPLSREYVHINVRRRIKNKAYA